MEFEGYDVVVVGGGIAGLTAAHKLSEKYQRVLVLEKATETGGRVKSSVVDGNMIELGAAFISQFYATTLDLIADVDLSSLLVEGAQPAYVARERVPEPIWPLPELLKGRAISPPAKLRMAGIALDLAARWRILNIADLSRSASLDSSSSATSLRRRVGAENLDIFFGPLLRGLLYWDADTTSYPVVLAVLKAFATNGSSLRMAGGLSQFPKALSRNLEVHTDVAVSAVDQDAKGSYIISADASGSSRTYTADAVVVATTAGEAARIVSNLPTETLHYLRTISYSRTALLTFRVSASSAGYPKGSVLFPTSGVRDLAAVNAHIEINPTTEEAPKTRLVHVYLSDEGFGQHGNLPDKELASVVLDRISDELGPLEWLQGAYLINVHRWEMALPRFDVGHLRRTNDFITAQPVLSRAAFAGDYLGGPYLDGAVRSGLTAAHQICHSLAPTVNPANRS